MGVAALLGLAFWVVDGFLNYFYFRSYLRFMIFEHPESPLETVVLNIPPYALFVRISFLVACFIGGLLVWFVLDKERKARDALRESEEKYRALFETAPESITLIGLDGTILDCNKQTEDLSGLARQDLIGQPFTVLSALMSEYIISQYLEIFSKLKQGEPVGSIEMRTTRSDQGVQWIEAFPALIQRAGQLVAVQVISRDITQRKQFEEALHRRQRELESLLETSRDLSSILDLEHLLSVIAQRATTLLEADKCTLLCREEDGITLSPILVVGDDIALLKDIEFRVGEGIGGLSIAQNQPILANQAQDDPRGVRVPGTPKDIPEHVMAAPLAFRDQTTGAMIVNRAGPRVFTEEDLHIFVGFARQAAVAIQNAQLFQRLEAYSASLEQAVEARTVELRQTKERVEAILRGSPDVILLLGPDGSIESANAAFHTVFGYTLAEIQHRLSSVLVSADGTATFEAMLSAALEHGETGRLEITARRKDGLTFDADVAFAPVKEDAVVTGLVCSIRDISALKEVERMKDAFVSNVSHELRTPISSIKLYLYLMHREPGKLETYMARLKRETVRLEHIIDDLLFLSRLDQDQITLTLAPVNLNDLADEYVTDRQVLADTRKLALTFTGEPDLPLVQADAGLLGQALSVLLTNALSYTPAGGLIEVCTQQRTIGDHQWVGMSVGDTGPGIPAEELPHLFDRFYRGSVGSESGTPGTGLGLALLKEIVERHGGTIEITSTAAIDQGARFTIWLPASA
jgi:PAS domain S-box-containing protein